LPESTLRNRRPKKQGGSSEEQEQPESRNEAKVIESAASSILDVFKGIFIFFMLAEHTRSSFHVDMNWKDFPLMHIISQVACALDMTSFSTASGFSCQRSYFNNEVRQRTLAERAMRAMRSVWVIYVAAFISNFTFDMAVRDNAPTLASIFSLASFQTLYWDFLTTFPLIMLLGFLTTRPALDFARGSSPKIQLAVYTALVAWPLAISAFPLSSCPTATDKYVALFLGCTKRSNGAMRFSAFSYMFFFNFGAIVSETVSGYIRTKTIPRPVVFFFSTLVALEGLMAVPLLLNLEREWEYFDWNGYHRFPMSPKLTLGWAFMSLGALMLATLIVRLKAWIRVVCDFLEHLGANVLLYLLVSNLVINGFFHNRWVFSKRKIYSDREWEYVTILAAIGQIVTTRFIIYLAKSGRR